MMLPFDEATSVNHAKVVLQSITKHKINETRLANSARLVLFKLVIPTPSKRFANFYIITHS